MVRASERFRCGSAAAHGSGRFRAGHAICPSQGVRPTPGSRHADQEAAPAQLLQHECNLEVHVPRVRLQDGKVALVEPDWVGKLCGFPLLFEALVLMLAEQMPFAAVERIVGETWHRVHAICARCVDLALERADPSAVDAVAIKRGHNYLTLAADADARRVVFVTEGRDADTIAAFAQHLRAHNADPENIASVSIDMSPAFIKGVTDKLPNARITFDKFDVIPHASQAVDKTRRVEQRTDLTLKGLRWALLKDRSKLSTEQTADLDISSINPHAAA
jgi:transposase